MHVLPRIWIDSASANRSWYTGDDAVKATMRQHGVKSWGPRTDIKAVQSMLGMINPFETSLTGIKPFSITFISVH